MENKEETKSNELFEKKAKELAEMTGTTIEQAGKFLNDYMTVAGKRLEE